MATIEVIDGPMTGQIFKVSAAKVLLGRDSQCDIRIDSHLVSRRHAQILSIKNNYFVADWGSRNGTYVNGRQLNGCMPLVDGDRVQICDVVFKFHNELSGKPSKARQKSQLRAGQENVTVLLGSDVGGNRPFISSAYNAQSLSSTVHEEATARVKLHALLEVMNNLSDTLNLDKLLANLLDSLFKIFALADRGFIVMNDQQGILQPRWSKLRQNSKGETLKISRVIIDHVMGSKEVVLSEDAASDQRFDSSKSILAYKIHSVMCAPLINNDGNVFGVLQVDSFNRIHRFKEEDLEVFAGVAAQAAIVINNAQLHEYAIEQRVREKDLDLAHLVQQSFLPEQKPDIDQYCFYHFYHPAEKIGGDFYDYIVLADGRIAVIVADVTGHGVAAALLMVKLSAHVRFSLSGVLEPVQVVKELNNIFCDNSLDDRFITFVMILLNPDNDELIIVNAGHMAPLIRHQSGEVKRIGADVAGVPLGIVSGFEYESEALQILPGELIVMYTDGINEAENHKHEFYGDNRIEKMMAASNENAVAFGSQLIDDLQGYCNSQHNKDDITLVAFSRKS